MPSPRAVLSPLLVSLILILAAPSVSRAAVFTIELTSGETLKNVTGEIDQQFKVIQLEDGRAVSFADIAAIQMGGVDVTREILGRDVRENPPEPSGSPSAEAPAEGEAQPPPPDVEDSPRTVRGPWLSESSEDYRAAHRPLWRWGIKVGGNFSTPAGTYYDGFGSGAGYDVEVWAAVTHNIALRAAVSRSGADLDDDIYLIALDPSLSILSQNLGVRVMRYYLAAEAYRHLDRASGRLSMMYFYAGLGAVDNRISVDARLSDGTRLDASTSETKFLTNMGVGVTLAATRNLGVDLGVHVDQIWVESDSYRDTFAWIFDLKAGLVALF